MLLARLPLGRRVSLFVIYRPTWASLVFLKHCVPPYLQQYDGDADDRNGGRYHAAVTSATTASSNIVMDRCEPLAAAKIDLVYNLVSLLQDTDKASMSGTLLSMSMSREHSTAMHRSGSIRQ